MKCLQTMTCAAGALLVTAAAALAVPSGYGGTFYVGSQVWNGSGSTLSYGYVDVDADWNVIVPDGAPGGYVALPDVTQVSGAPNLPGVLNVWTPGTRGDATLALGAYHDNVTYMNVVGITKGGVYDINRGINSGPCQTQNSKQAMPVDAAFMDVPGSGDTTKGVYTDVGNPGWRATVWQDIDNDGYYEENSYVSGGDGGPNGGADMEYYSGKIYYERSGSIYTITFNPGEGSYTTHEGASVVPSATRGNSGIAVGDVGDDNKLDVYFVSTTWATIMHGVDNNEDGAISADEVSVLYNNNTEGTGSNRIRTNGFVRDLELIPCPDGSYVLSYQSDYTSASHSGMGLNTLAILELDDNGDWGGSSKAIICAPGLNTGGWWDNAVDATWPVNTSVYQTEFVPLETTPVTPGDANGDGKVDGGDLALWQQHYDPLGLNAANNTFADGDFNGDGKIDGGDLALWQQYYNPLGTAGIAGGTSVPEPATLLLLGSGLLGGLGVMRRRNA